ncbi:MAG: hypothetical protein CR989_02770 [Flavobacteriales bacterium]|nr:MAG: hypothetical protein CR989_02770 [Flavobacteriales bacterium]
MNKTLGYILFFMGCISAFAQADFSQNWLDYFSYNNIKDLLVVENQVYAITDNAVFIYDNATETTKKLSSVNGLSGEETSAILYSSATENLVIGYASGLMEVINKKGKITIATDIERLTITPEKNINHFFENDNKLYLSTAFGIVIYDLERLEFDDTYFIGNNASPLVVNQIVIYNGYIYAATENGIYRADKDANLLDFNNWQLLPATAGRDFYAISVFNGVLYTISGNMLYSLQNQNLQLSQSFPEKIVQLKSSATNLTITCGQNAHIFNTDMQLVAVSGNTADYSFKLQTAVTENNVIYLGTDNYGILRSTLSSPLSYTEIHPEGPSSNKVFSITAKNNDLWVVYGGYNAAYTPMQNAKGYSHFNGTNWINTRYSFDFPARDLVHVTIDPNHENKVYISSFAQSSSDQLDATGGLLVVENDQPTVFLNHTNSGLEDLAPDDLSYNSVRINGTAFDENGNLWITNSWVSNRLKKWDIGSNWTSFDLSSLITNRAFGLNELVIDKNNSIWIGSRRNGALVFNPNGNRMRALTTETNKGGLPDLNVRSLAVDRNNRMWIGTQKGLVVFSDTGNLFDADIYNAEPIIIEDDGIARKLMGEQSINSIAIDGAGNKWFGTDNAGVLATNASGQKTLYRFNKDNSPLPSNRIMKIQINDSNGHIIIATDKGIVVFDSNVAPFGKGLDEVYAYPNPARKNHEFITIDGRNGTHLPRGTNVKIVDAAGRLVYETNVVEGQELKGGKVIWNKTNLAGRGVASGVYIVLLTTPDTSETAITKIAIIN